MTVPVVVHADHGALQSAHSREQSGGSVALVVVGHGSAAPLLQRKSRLRTVQRLDLALFIGAQHEGVLRGGAIGLSSGAPVSLSLAHCWVPLASLSGPLPGFWPA